MQLKLQLESLTKGALSMLEYIEKKRSIADALAEDLQPISDEDLINYLLSRLDSSNGGFATAFMMAADQLSVDDLIGLLLQEEARQEQECTWRSALIPNPSVAPSLVAYDAYHSSNRSFDARSGARQAASSPNFNSSAKPRPTCQLCRVVGHEAINCRERTKLDAFPRAARLSCFALNLDHSNVRPMSLIIATPRRWLIPRGVLIQVPLIMSFPTLTTSPWQLTIMVVTLFK
ncbi:hypothetical protein LINGRAHAP2_LOCUS30450 [Linum grandiflorum]